MSSAPRGTSKSKPAVGDVLPALDDDANRASAQSSMDAANIAEISDESLPEDNDEGVNAGEQVATFGNNADRIESHNSAGEPSNSVDNADAPPLPEEEVPPLPEEAVPPLPNEAPPTAAPVDDGWAPVWEETAQAYYFYNRFTGATQWANPRVPETTVQTAPGVETTASTLPTEAPPSGRPAGGYDPAIHGDYDSTAWYAQALEVPEVQTAGPVDPAAMYGATGAFNRFTGRWQAADITPDNHNDENKSKRQMNAFFDVDAAANSHDGKSLKAERRGQNLSKQELKKFKEKRKAKKEEKRRAWLLD